MLRATAGACNVEYILQTLTRSSTDNLVSACSDYFRQTHATLLRSEMDDCKWTHATLPQRRGGHGLRHPQTVVDTARLESLVNVSERAVGMDADKIHVDRETEKSVSKCMAAVGAFLRPELPPSRELQKTDPASSRSRRRLALA